MPGHPDPPGDFPQGKIKSLESIRGLAALMVVVHHVPAWSAYFYDLRFIRNAYLLVDLFFVLSGFVIYNAYADKLKSYPQLLRFQFLRFGRLYPVHLLFLGIAVIFEILKYWAHTKFSVAMPNGTPFKENNWVALLEQLFLVQDIGPTGNALTFNSAAWSISVEFYTYLIFGLTVLFADKFKHVIYLVFVFVAVALLVNQTTFGSTDLVRCIAGFFVGCLTAGLTAQSRIRVHPALSVVAFLALIIFLGLQTDSQLNFAIYLLTSALILTLVSSRGGWLHTFLNLKPLIWLGTISYSIYMSHTTVIWIINQVYRELLKGPVALAGHRMTPQLPVFGTAISYVLVVICVLIVSHVVYKWVEEPLRQKSRSMDFPGNFRNRR